MKAIILAAGTGSRLDPLFVNTPKSLINLNSKEKILERSLKQLCSFGIYNITLVIGYEYKQFDDIKIPEKVKLNKIICPFYKITNNIVSLWFARDQLNEEIIVMYADILYQDLILEELIKAKNDVTITIDLSVKTNADYKVTIDQDKIIVMSKKLEHYDGEYVGICKFSQKAAQKLKNRIDAMIMNNQTNDWYEDALVDMIYTDDNFHLNFLDCSNEKWVEIDTVNDLAKAKRIFG